jgi:Fe-S-cluster-containing dehydrogenase component
MSEYSDPCPAPSTSDVETPNDGTVDRRAFLSECLKACGCAAPILFGLIRVPILDAQESAAGEYDPSEHLYGMGIDVSKCIGCGQCVRACKTENDVPLDPHFFNTWVERYVIRTNDEVEVDSPNGGMDGFPPISREGGIRRTFLVPKLCNHCATPPCVQVCPVGATFITEDGVVLVDDDYCIGCRYCIQACPYGARWLNPETHVAAKCTFCYHRVVQGLVPACVEVCPTGARIFGEVERRVTPLARFTRFNDIQVLKPHLNTRPKAYYANLDGEVR